MKILEENRGKIPTAGLGSDCLAKTSTQQKKKDQLNLIKLNSAHLGIKGHYPPRKTEKHLLIASL